MKLKVTQPFGKYRVGEEIADEAEVKRILASEQAQYVVKVQSESKPPKK